MSKRKKPESTDWSEVDLKRLNQKDLRVLLQTRGEKEIPTKRDKMEEAIKAKDVEIEYKEEMTGKQLCAELKLRGLDNTNAKKDILLQRLRGEIAAPPKIKVRRVPKKKKAKAYGANVHAALYLPPVDKNKDDSDDTQLLGVYLQARAAFEAIFERFLSDLKKVDEKKHGELAKDFEEGPFDEDNLKKLTQKCNKVWDEESMPKGWVSNHKIQ